LTTSTGPADLVTLLTLAMGRLKRELDTRLAAAGFTDLRPAYGYAFSRISFGGATGVELAEHLGITKQSAGQMVDEMEKSGYVRREPHPTDRRGKLIVLTDRGWVAVRTAGKALAEMERELAGALGAEGYQALLTGLAAAAGHTDGPWHGLRPPW
jgi:DNA-binding MarR family transcriptional regulator